LFDDLVSCISYKRTDGSAISLSEIGALLQADAPKADWSVEPEKDNTGIAWWYGQLSRDPFAYQADYTKDNAVSISTRADSEMLKEKQKLQWREL
jgi:hypothetical protein